MVRSWNVAERSRFGLIAFPLGKGRPSYRLPPNMIESDALHIEQMYGIERKDWAIEYMSKTARAQQLARGAFLMMHATRMAWAYAEAMGITEILDPVERMDAEMAMGMSSQVLGLIATGAFAVSQFGTGNIFMGAMAATSIPLQIIATLEMFETYRKNRSLTVYHERRLRLLGESIHGKY